MKKNIHMIPIGLILIVVGLTAFAIGLNEELKGDPIEVGQQWLTDDPFAQHLFVTITEKNGEWVRYRQAGDAEGTFRSTKITTFRAWYPNRYIKSATP